MKPAYRLLSVLLLSLPLVSVVLVYDYLPPRLPVHFNAAGQPDLFTNRQQWLSRLLITTFVLNIGRAMLMRLVGSQRNLQPAQLQALYLLTAGSVAGIVSLLALDGVLGIPVFADWLPILFFLSGSGILYFSVPPDRTRKVPNPVNPDHRMVRHLATLQYVHALSRWVVIRVNIAAAILMVFVGRSDRWQVGLMANLLAYLFLTIVSEVARRRPG